MKRLALTRSALRCDRQASSTECSPGYLDSGAAWFHIGSPVWKPCDLYSSSNQFALALPMVLSQDEKNDSKIRHPSGSLLNPLHPWRWRRKPWQGGRDGPSQAGSTTNLDCAAPTLIEFLLNQGDENRCVPDYPCLPQCWLYPFPLQHLFPLQHQGRKNRRYDFSG